MKIPFKKDKNLLLPNDSDYADEPESFSSSGEYLDFSSNGMTDNEKIDEYNYYDNYLGYNTDDDT